MSDKIKIKIHDYSNLDILRELIDEFLPPDQYELLADDGFRRDRCLHINLAGSGDRDQIKRELFRELERLTGKRPDWGILTGVRPVKLAGEMMDREGKSREETYRILTGDYFLTREKAELITSVYELQKKRFGIAAENSVGIYIGIPFCPTRCLYCSFASNQVPESEIDHYLPALYREIAYVGDRIREYGLRAESVYIGGGTPTTLSPDQLRELTDRMEEAFHPAETLEYTVEAGRPDTITDEKLDVLEAAGVTRISINPQSMHQKTLDLIGRAHSPEEIVQAFRMAAERNFSVINADLICGLPGEDQEDFVQSLEEILALGANNVTIHTLAVKRASRLRDIDRDYHYKVADTVAGQLGESQRILKDRGFRPYYLYRQKHMAGYFENTGYSMPGLENLYNTRIMDEHQTIIALGAGGISKRYYPQNNLLIRVPNVTNYREYISRIDEMLLRKENKLRR